MKYYLKKKMIWILFSFIFLFGLTIPIKASAEISAKETANIIWQKDLLEIEEGDYKYYTRLSEDGNYAWIEKVSPIENNHKELVFPEKPKGAVLVRIGHKEDEDEDDNRNIWGSIVEPYHNVDGYGELSKGIEKVTIPSTVTEIYSSAFCGFRDLTSIKIPDGVENIPYSCFYQCENLKKVILPGGLKTIQREAFKKCKQLTKMEISSNSKHYICEDGLLLSKDHKTAVWAVTGYKNIQIPSGVKRIASFAFIDSYVKKISIPASVNRLESRALSGKKIKSITIAKDNKQYGEENNCIYDKKNHTLLVALCKDGTVTLPKQVKYLTKQASYAGKAIEKLVIPKTFKEFRKGCFTKGFNAGMNCKIYLESEIPPKASKDCFGVFVTYCVPKKSVEKYETWYCKAEGLENIGQGYVNFMGY